MPSNVSPVVGTADAINLNRLSDMELQALLRKTSEDIRRGVSEGMDDRYLSVLRRLFSDGRNELARRMNR